MNPVHMGAYLILFFPVAYSIALMKAFSMKLRVFCGALAFLLVAVAVQVFDFRIIALLAILLVALPFVVSCFPKRRWIAYGINGGGLLFMLLFLGLGSDVVRDRFEERFDAQSPLTWVDSQARAWDLFIGNPVFGAGYGSGNTAVIGLYTHENVPDASDLSGEYLQTLSAHGLFGLLFILPIFYALFLAWRTWAGIDFVKISRDEQFRNMHHNVHGLRDSGRDLSEMAHQPRDMASRSAPTTKVLLGGIATGVSAFALCFVFASPFQSGIMLIVFMLMLALMIAFTQPRSVHIENDAVGIAGFAVAGLCAGLVLRMSIQPSVAQVYMNEADKLCEERGADDESIRKVLRRRFDAYDMYSSSLGLFPDNVHAKVQQASILYELSGMFANRASDFRSKADALVAEALTDAPDFWLAYTVKAKGLSVSGASAEQVETAWKTATEKEPGSAAAWTMYAEHLSSAGGRSADMAKAIDKALSLAPDYEPALALKRMAQSGN